MIFTEFRFVFFFLAAFLVHWALRGNRSRKVWLLLCSYAFYSAWNYKLLWLLVASTLVDYVAGLMIDRSQGRWRKLWVAISVTFNLGLLGVYKYLGFFAESAAALSEWLGIPVSVPALEIVLPVGISFFTFQTMSYSLDIYFGRLKPTRDVLDLALFVGFFPQLVAGPIVRAVDFLPQLDAKRVFANVAVRANLLLFLVGFVKKACVSDNVVEIVDPFFEAPAEFSVLGAWTGVLMYAVQIYCDFSGYSDMAIACAGLLGYQLRLNFDFPYLATDIRDFWRRWHISLSSWLRDYLYVPLGGNRGGKLRHYRNLMLTMLLGGLWHGAGWNFVIWGGLHGGALIVHREWERLGVAGRLPGAIARPVALALTFWWVCLAWIFFRSATLDGALEIARAWVAFDSPGTRSFGWMPIVTLAGLALVHRIAATRAVGALWERLPDWGFAVAYGVAVPLVLAFMNGAVQPFIYFQF